MPPDPTTSPRRAPRPLLAGGVFAVLVILVAPAFGEERLRRCVACHELRDGAQVIVKGGRSGPNLFGILNRPAGSLDGYNFSEDLQAAGAAGLVFDRQSLAAFATNPNVFLSDYLGRPARSKMPLGFPDDIAKEAATFLAQ